MLQAARVARKVINPAVFSRAYALDGAKGFSEKEAAVEALYFNKEDERLMAKLMAKIKQQSDTSDKHSAEGMRTAEKSALKHIVDKYKIAEADINALLKWKHTHY